MSKRTNFKIMSKNNFISYLDKKDINYITFKTTTVLGDSVVKIKPNHFRLGQRVFELKSGKQVVASVELTDIPLETGTKTEVEKEVVTTENPEPITKQQLIKLIDNRIQNMGTKGVYHPKRLKPKWNSLTNDEDKMELFEKYLSNPHTSIGLYKLIEVNLCHKTLEAIIIEDLTAIKWLSSDGLLQNCINKFNKYKNGKEYLKTKGIEITDKK